MSSNPRRAVRALAMSMPLLVVLACSSEQSARVPQSLTVAAGDGQVAVVGTALANAIAVLLWDDLGNPIAGASVTWSVTAGGGSVAPATSTTSSNGQATTNWTLGGTVGLQTVTAATAGFLVTFSATAEAGPPPRYR